jgi:hypothetical protein
MGIETDIPYFHQDGCSHSMCRSPSMEGPILKVNLANILSL